MGHPANVWDAIADCSFDLEWREGLPRSPETMPGAVGRDEGPREGSKTVGLGLTSPTKLSSLTTRRPTICGQRDYWCSWWLRTVQLHGERAMFMDQIELQRRAPALASSAWFGVDGCALG